MPLWLFMLSGIAAAAATATQSQCKQQIASLHAVQPAAAVEWLLHSSAVLMSFEDVLGNYKHSAHPACPSPASAVICCSILVVSVTDHFLWQDYGFRMLVASFGASAVLLYGVPESKLAQPRNLIGTREPQIRLLALGSHLYSLTSTAALHSAVAWGSSSAG
jgi:hypothetical protein